MVTKNRDVFRFLGGFEAQMDLELIQQVQLMRLYIAAWEMTFSQHLEI